MAFKNPTPSVVTRIVGRNLEAARPILQAAGITVETDLDTALVHVRSHLDAAVPGVRA